MSRAIPGAPYVVRSGDSLSDIARQAYGQGKRWREIWEANKTQLRSGDPNVIFPGETINIPPDNIVDSAKDDLLSAIGLPTLPGKEKDDFTFIIGGKELPVESGRVFSAMDSGVRAWTASILWNSENIEWYNRLKPYGYQQAEVYLGPNLGGKGILYTQAVRGNQEGVRKDLFCWTKTADLVDSSVEPPFEQKLMTLQARALGLCTPKGVLVKFEMPADPPFSKITARQNDKIFSHLAGLASQRGGLISVTPLGELLFTTPAIGKSIGTIAESWPPGDELAIKFDGRKRFNTYKATAKSPGRKNKIKAKLKIALSKDIIVPTSRLVAFDASDTTAGDIQIAADWRRSKQLAESLSIPQKLSGWYSPDGQLWRENTIVTLESASLHISQGYDFLIRSVEFLFSKEGPSTMLQLVPPEAYSGLPVKEPWGIPGSPSSLTSLIKEIV
jgi:hypothetical protein